MNKLPISPPDQGLSLSQELATLAASFRPRTFSFAWFLRLPGRLWRGSKLMILWSLIISLARASAQAVGAGCGRIAKLIHAVSVGIEVGWEFTGIAFRWFIDKELWLEIKESRLSRQALGAGIIVMVTWLLYDLQHGFSKLGLAFFVYQGLRLLAFLGMEGGPLTPDKPALEGGARRRIATYDQLEEEEDD